MRIQIMKFRAWDILNKTMSFWTMNDLCAWSTDKEQPSALDKWMQFTGLHDKNGKEIYEGDIVCLDGMTADNSMGVLPNGWKFDEENGIFEVQYNNEFAGFDLKIDITPTPEVKEEFGDYADAYMRKWRNHARSLWLQGDCKVIGNIYEGLHSGEKTDILAT